MTIIRFAFVVQNEVSHMLELDENADSPVVPGLINTYRSNPTFVEITDEQKKQLGKGWTWDGQNFYPPVE